MLGLLSQDGEQQNRSPYQFRQTQLPSSTVGNPAVTHLRGKRRPTLRGISSSRIVFRGSKNILFLIFNSRSVGPRDCLPNAWWLSNA